MKFYTNVTRKGNSILYCGYNNNQRILEKVPFRPVLFVESSQAKGTYRSLYGQKLEPILFEDMRSASDFLKKYDHVDNFTVHGMQNFVYQFIAAKFPNEVTFDREAINVCTIDIEVASDQGFPLPDEAKHEVISITCKNNKDKKYHVWGLYDYDVEKTEMDVEYYWAESEQQLLQKFLKWWNDPFTRPDVVTGWNTRLFDIPYLVNRIRNVLGEQAVKKLSPWGIVSDSKAITRLGQEAIIYELEGIANLDYYDLFDKFGRLTYGEQESYKLDHIANVVLGEKKLSYEEFGNLHTLYREDFQKFIDYNIKDVELVDRLEEKMGLITLAMTMAYKAKANYKDAFGTTNIWDSVIYNELLPKNIVVPPKVAKSKATIVGGYVKEPVIGMHEWVCSFDLNSLYPNIIVQYNMSPETLTYQEDGDFTIAANGTKYRKDVEGIIPKVIKKFYIDRVDAKNKMLEAKKEYEKTPTKKLANDITIYDNQQMAVKILMNSLYGALANRWFRYFDLKIAEAVTTSGQRAILCAEKSVNNEMQKLLGTKHDYVIAIDTDSVYINMSPLVSAHKPANPVKYLDKVCEHFEKVIAEDYVSLAQETNAYENRMVMKREAIADRGIWTAKKRYILNVHNNEGVQYAQPKLKIMGIEAVKSSTPQICREKLKTIFTVIMQGNESDTQEFISEFKSQFRNLAPEEVAFPRSVKHFTKFHSPKTIYIKGTPIHCRGSLLYNKYLKEYKLERKYDVIKDGEKIKFLYLKEPNHFFENVIAFPGALPLEFNLHKHVDYDVMFDKAFLEPLRPILDSISWTEEPVSDLSAFLV